MLDFVELENRDGNKIRMPDGRGLRLPTISHRDGLVPLFAGFVELLCDWSVSIDCNYDFKRLFGVPRRLRRTFALSETRSTWMLIIRQDARGVGSWRRHKPETPEMKQVNELAV